MPRSFVALPLPDEAKDRLLAIQPPTAPGMRLLGREELHLTLHFLGDVAANDVDAVRAALATVRITRFTVALKGVGQFPHDGRPQVLWAGVGDSAELTALHRTIGIALTEAIGFQPEQRPYSPHVTLARINAPVPPDMIHRYLEENRGFAIPSVLFDRFVLYSSSFADGVPRYQEEAVFPLLGCKPACLANLRAVFEQSEFVKYHGPPEIHDGVIQMARRHNSNLEVVIRGTNGVIVSVVFREVTDVYENRAEGMMVYALAEYRQWDGRRLFSFANWEAEDDALLSVVAAEIVIQVSHLAGE